MPPHEHQHAFGDFRARAAEGLCAVSRRNMADSRIEALSDDGRFEHAYGAARTLATIVIRAEGYRVRGQGGAHYNTFLALEAADPGQFAGYAQYFDTCRGKRNELSYDVADVVSRTEVEEILDELGRFERTVEGWLARRWPELSKE